MSILCPDAKNSKQDSTRLPYNDRLVKDKKDQIKGSIKLSLCKGCQATLQANILIFKHNFDRLRWR